MISIIIPVYNVKDYIVKCLESVAAQTYTGAMECLLIDDCSQDNSIQFAEEFVTSYNGHIEFRIIHHERNRGLSAARNTGIKESNGEWLYFLDSDDWIIPECIQLMLECVYKYPDIEMVQGGGFSNDENYYNWLSLENKPNEFDYCSNQYRINEMLLKQKILVVTVWNKLIRKELILDHNLYFEEGALNEDEMWSFLLSKFIKSVAICKKDTYYYNVRQGSIIQDQDKIRANYPRILEYLLSYVGGRFKKREVLRIAIMTLDFQKYNITLEQRERFRKIKLSLIFKSNIRQAIELSLLFFAPNFIKKRIEERVRDKYLFAEW